MESTARPYSSQRLIFWNTVASTRGIHCHIQGAGRRSPPPPPPFVLFDLGFILFLKEKISEKQKIVCRQVQMPPISSPPRQVTRACGTMVGQNVGDRPLIGRMLTLVNPVAISGTRVSVGAGMLPSHGRAGGKERRGRDSVSPGPRVLI